MNDIRGLLACGTLKLWVCSKTYDRSKLKDNVYSGVVEHCCRSIVSAWQRWQMHPALPGSIQCASWQALQSVGISSCQLLCVIAGSGRWYCFERVSLVLEAGWSPMKEIPFTHTLSYHNVMIS